MGNAALEVKKIYILLSGILRIFLSFTITNIIETTKTVLNIFFTCFFLLQNFIIKTDSGVEQW